MSAIARRLTGMTASQLREYEFRGVYSTNDIFKPRSINLRQNVRLAAGAMVGVNDLNQARRRLAQLTPKSLL